MRSLLLVISFLFSLQSIAQVEASTTNFDFGDIYKGAKTYTDITFKNTSGKVQFLLTLDKPADVYYIFSSKRILPDSTITIRFQINEKRKGRFNYDVQVFFSEPRDPIVISLIGNVKETVGGSMTACPDFNSAPPAHMNEFDMVVKVIDSLTGEPINNARVYVVQNGELIGEYLTNTKGFIKRRMMLGYFYITADKAPYISNYYEGYMNYTRSYVEIGLNQGIPEEPVLLEEPEIIPDDTIAIVINDNLPPPTIDTVEIFINAPVPDTEVVAVVVPEQPLIVAPYSPPVESLELTAIPDTVFTENYFKFNNITFILDVSASMNGMGKMDLLKMCMIELAKILRPNDIVSIIKYSSEVELVMDGTTGVEKDKIIATVKGLRTSGLTAGGDAIKTAYKVNKKHYIPQGNNIVIMITDGVFNKGDKDYLKTIQKYYQSSGTIFSVVGIKTSDFITAHMKNIVQVGGGDFVRILSVDDAKKKLIQEIRRTSFKI